jgi:hypothetical protein
VPEAPVAAGSSTAVPEVPVGAGSLPAAAAMSSVLSVSLVSASGAAAEASSVAGRCGAPNGCVGGSVPGDVDSPAGGVVLVGAAYAANGELSSAAPDVGALAGGVTGTASIGGAG